MSLHECRIYVSVADAWDSLASVQIRADVLEDVTSILQAAGLPGVTVIPCWGYWDGATESSLLIDVLTADFLVVRRVARELRRAFNQQVVITTRSIAPLHVDFIDV